MPLTRFQQSVLRLLADNRSADSFIAGGAAINAAPDSPRFSADIDIFHDVEERVSSAAMADAALLARQNFTVEWVIQRPGFQQVVVSHQGQSLRLEWTHDSAFRFFPVQPDPDFGWRLHLADLATNKVLALAGRWEIRDFVDTLYLDENFASLGLLAWAAAGKDLGVTPAFILEQASRFNRLRSEDFLGLFGADKFDYVAMKRRWSEAMAQAQELVAAFPPEEVGALYLDEQNLPVDPRSGAVTRVHYASLGGALPQIVGSSTPLPGNLELQAENQVRQRYQQER